MRLLNILMALLFVAGLWSCEKDEIKATLSSSANPAVTFSKPSVVLSKDNADNDVLTISWAKPQFGFEAAPAYVVYIDKKGGSFLEAYISNVGSALEKKFTGKELNNLLLDLGLEPNQAADLDVKVVATLGAKTEISSTVSPFKATPYLEKIDRTTNWGIVGSATPNAWNGPDIPLLKSDQPNVLVTYVQLVEGEVKFRQDNKWDVNYGDTGTNGTLDAGGDNIKVTAGAYKITLNIENKTYTIENFSWGVVGSSTPNGWNGPDIYLSYDPVNNVFKATATLEAGELKFRQNNDWAVNYGDTGANGTLDAGGDNVKVEKKGNYLITFDPQSGTYSIESFNIFGIVGDATATGWNGPDQKFHLDFTQENVWILKNVILKDGEIKFRANDDWLINYGDTSADNILEAGGDNIKVKAGAYDVVLNFQNSSKPSYSLTKK